MKLFTLLILFLLSLSIFVIVSMNVTAYAQGHIRLLTVSETLNNTDKGGVADLYLVVKPGSGRIFIDSYPLSKLDTQITMRFATEVACDLLEKDCSGYDFFYTISATSAVVGGPSAGAAATVLTVSVLDNQQLDQSIIMTGTINSGNLIGPVAGVPAKAQAAQENGYKKLLIPAWDIVNNTPSSDLKIDIIPVSTLEEALWYFTGKNYSKDYSISIKDQKSSKKYFDTYSAIMQNITDDLCHKYSTNVNGIYIFPNLKFYGINITNASQDNFILAKNAIDTQSYYSAASFCFSGNVKIHAALLKNMSNDELKVIYAKTLTDIDSFNRKLTSKSTNIQSISELETYMIVAERIYDAKSLISEMNPENISSYQLAYAIERYNTAIVWSRFFNLPGQKFVMDKELLKVVCSKKLSEAEERLNYLNLYYPQNDIRKDLDLAYTYYQSEEYALCIFSSSRVKADSDIVLSAIFVPENETDTLFDTKMRAAKNVIDKQSSAGIFPILGYSYYEYARTLKSNDDYSAVIYAEYSLELSNIDMYFKKNDALNLPMGLTFKLTSVYLLALGFAIGILFSVFVMFLSNKFGKKKSVVKNKNVSAILKEKKRVRKK